MCLFSKWRFPRKAKEDIICYKLLERRFGIWSTPYRNTPVVFNNMMVPRVEHTVFVFSFSRGHEKGIGYIHAYTTKYNLNDIYYIQGSRAKIGVFKAIIPKGTRYHISKHGFEICAKKMIITNERLY